jgi:hypothetical protein
VARQGGRALILDTQLDDTDIQTNVSKKIINKMKKNGKNIYF